MPKKGKGTKDKKGREEQRDEKIQVVTDRDDPTALSWAKHFVSLVYMLQGYTIG
jgi:hypothetical protein